MKTKKSNTRPFNGVILFEGKSAIDGVTDIAVIATCLKKPSKNRKTGEMIQVWILVKDQYPTEAMDSGLDSAICGNCPHRKIDGKRTCYVTPKAIGSVYRSYKRGSYPMYNAKKHNKYFRKRKVRFGAYGDPVCIPIEIVKKLSKLSKGHTGYTHQWRDPKFSNFQKYFQASCDNIIDFIDASSLGWSTFRVLKSVEDRQKGKEAICQGGIKTDCETCVLCSGSEKRQTHVAVEAHGNGKKYFVG